MDDLYRRLNRRSRSEMAHELLEGFDIISSVNEVALVPKRFSSLREKVEAAVMASTLGLSSIDYAKRKYCTRQSDDEPIDEDGEEAEYIASYRSVKNQILKLMSRFSKQEDLPLPSNGVFGASIVLERLLYSFFSSHLLYQLGHRHEAHAVSRLILEQIAWAHSAYELDSIEDIKKIVTTQAISRLKKVQPECGRIYGFLSEKTHIDYRSHFEFVGREKGRYFLFHSQFNYYEYAQIILKLADLFSIVWEMSQFSYLTEIECLSVRKGLFLVREDRPFLKTIQQHLRKIESAGNSKATRIDRG